MVRDDGHEADVHPAEVENYAAGGYRKAETPTPKKTTKKAD